MFETYLPEDIAADIESGRLKKAEPNPYKITSYTPLPEYERIAGGTSKINFKFGLSALNEIEALKKRKERK